MDEKGKRYDIEAEVMGILYDAINKANGVVDELFASVADTLRSIRDDCHDEHFTLTDIADELDDLIKEIG